MILLERYRDFLPITSRTPLITLHEGNTPLIRVGNFEKYLDLKNVRIYLKYEGMNPTGSFKDRGMVMAIAKALEKGARYTICASTGNTAASAAAYSARTGLKSVVLIPEGKIALGKLAQAMIYGAKVVQINGNFDRCLELVRYLSENYDFELVNSINPYRIEGQKTAAFEIVDELGRAPDYHFIPVGNAGNITSYWKGYKEYKSAGDLTEFRVAYDWQNLYLLIRQVTPGDFWSPIKFVAIDVSPGGKEVRARRIRGHGGIQYLFEKGCGGLAPAYLLVLHGAVQTGGGKKSKKDFQKLFEYYLFFE